MSWGAAHAMCMTWHMHAPRAHHSCTPASRPEAHLRRTHQTKAHLRSEGVAFTGASEPRMPGVIPGKHWTSPGGPNRSLKRLF